MAEFKRIAVGAQRTFLILLAVLLLGIVLVSRSEAEPKLNLPVQLPGAHSKTVSDDCQPNTGWRWVRGQSLPETATLARQELLQAGIDASVVARSFGEVDSCGTYLPFATDFIVELNTRAPVDDMPDRDRTTQIIRQVLAQVARPSLGTLQITVPNGELVFLRPDAAARPLIVAAPGPDSSAVILTKKVYVVIYDPILSGGQYLSDYLHWNEHATLTQGTVDFFSQASHGEVNYQVVQSTVLTDGWPEKTDGFRYTEQEYLYA